MEVILEGRKVMALIDCGASMSVISLGFVRGLGKPLVDIDFSAELANGDTIAALGRVDLWLQVAGKEVLQPFLVFEDLSTRRYDAIVGSNVLSNCDLLVDVKRNRLVPAGSPEDVMKGTPGHVERTDTRTDGGPTVKMPLLGQVCRKLISQQVMSGRAPIQSLFTMMGEGESGFDDSVWEFQWKEIPVNEFDIGDTVTEQGCTAVTALVVEFMMLFHTDGKKMGLANVEPFNIELLPGKLPKFRPQYRYSPAEQEFIQEETAKMLTQAVIRKARSPHNSPIVLAKKEGGKARRLCNDFRAVNEVTIGDQFPLPNVDDCLAVLAGSKFFTTLDCQSGYWQVPLAENSKALTAFQAGNNFYEYEVMPFGLKNAPSAFQRMITTVLAGLLWIDVIVYIDDIVIGVTTQMRHLVV